MKEFVADLDPEVQALNLRLLEINQLLQSGMPLDDRPEGARSPSPKPIYDNIGIKINTRGSSAGTQCSSPRPTTALPSSRRSSILDPDSAPLSPEPRILKSRLVAGETLYGLFLLRSSPTLAEIAGLAGYDYMVVNMEHGSGSIVEALPCLHALAAARTPAILRLPELSAACAKKALDLGPQGLMFPVIESPGAAELAVSRRAASAGNGAVDVGIFRQAAVEDVRRWRSAEVDIGEESRKQGSDSK
ncbi:uncharacterized protein LOC103723178 [Phoenix dactylifera]|uniref:Uncharacterized protein LOC103723178 n=1 Tax=Phoenix dactylifera TaxID=42345 RepID=A0A8B9AXR1_PHODC|nr:uncharacterized protein LOC103723178 [Phoenix dactylifera]